MVVRKSKKSSPELEPAKILSDREIVKEKFKSAVCKPVKAGFCVLDQEEKGSPVHAGLADTKDAAWKLAAHAVL